MHISPIQSPYCRNTKFYVQHCETHSFKYTEIHRNRIKSSKIFTMQTEKINKHLESGLDLGFESSVEPSKGIIAGDIGFPLFVDIVLVVLLTDRVNSSQNIDHSHLLPNLSPEAPRSEITRRKSLIRRRRLWFVKFESLLEVFGDEGAWMKITAWKINFVSPPQLLFL